jgi:hypothetical protein
MHNSLYDFTNTNEYETLKEYNRDREDYFDYFTKVEEKEQELSQQLKYEILTKRMKCIK